MNIFQPLSFENQTLILPEDAGITFQNSRGFVVERKVEERCESWILVPAENLWDPGLRAFLYLFCMFYCFLGIAVVSDIFMSSIEVITSQTKIIKKKDPKTGERIEVTSTFWNPTVANLTLIAFGSSAPEIMLAAIETISTLGEAPGKLGPGTIVGSAAFNLLTITGVSIMAIQKGQFRKIEDYGVFIITGIFSLLAYVWLLIILDYWTAGEITLVEALITLILFPVLIIVSWLQDRRWFTTPKFDEPIPNYKLLNVEFKQSDGSVQADKKAVLQAIRKVRKKKHPVEDSSDHKDLEKEAKEVMTEISGGQDWQKKNRCTSIPNSCCSWFNWQKKICSQSFTKRS